MSRSPESSDESEPAPGASTQDASRPAPSSDRFSVLRLSGGSFPGALLGKLPGKEPLNPVVFFVSATIIAIVALAALIAPDLVKSAFGAAVTWTSRWFGSFYILLITAALVFILGLAFSRFGRIRLGPDNSTPDFSTFAWTAMLFAAGIGTEILFFAVAEPVDQYVHPPTGDAQAIPPATRAREAIVLSLFHYGISGWGLYALVGLAMAYFAYRRRDTLTLRSTLRPLLGRHTEGVIGDIVDAAALVGGVFGIAASLGVGVVQLNVALNILFGLPQGFPTQIGLTTLAVVMATVSAVSGVDRGVRVLSTINVLLAIGLALWVLVTGDAAFLIDALIGSIGDFFTRFPQLTLETYAYNRPDEWLNAWTLFFWAWWIAWAPFVGLFLARISRGRTLREFILGVLIIPFGFILLWVSIFGNAALDAFGADPGLAQRIVDAPESGFFEVLQQYPGATVTIGLAVLTGLLFYVTSADSGSLVMATMTSQAPEKTDAGGPAEQDGPPWLRIVWAVMTGLLTLVMLFIGGVYTLQAATVLIGLPFSLVLYLLMFSLWKVLRGERYSAQARRHALVGAQHTSEPRGSWKQRLTRKMAFPSAEQTARFIEGTAQPALEAVGAELEGLGVEVHYHRGTHPEYPIPYADLVVCFPDQDDFKYQAYPVAHAVPNFAANLAVVRDVYFRVEIFSATGSRGHSIMGYTREQVIADVLDAYEAHLNYMTLTGDAGAPTGEVHAAAPQKWEDNYD